MRKALLSISMLAALGLSAAEVAVTPSTLKSEFEKAADGDVLLLEAGAYGEQLTFPSGKTVTLRAAEGADVTMATLYRANDASLTGGGIVLEGITIKPTDSYLINLDNYGDITTITLRGCDISNIGRCFLRTSNTGHVIDEIAFDNCLIHDCGNGGWNFMYPKHIVRKISVSNSTLYNYSGGESFFCPQTADTNNALTFTFTNNTVYRWGKSNDRALAKVEKKYSAESVYTFTDNIIYKGGTDAVTPYVVHANSGKLVANNNLIVDYGDYNITDKSVNDLTLAGLGMDALPFPAPDGGDFTVTSMSPLAKASTTGGLIGDPRWLKQVSQAVTLNVAAAEGGSVTPANIILEAGENATVTATAAYGYRFKEWQDAAGKCVSTDNPYTFAIAADTELKAVFTAVDTYALTVNMAGDGAKWGRVKLNPEPVNGIYETGTEVTVTVVPNSVTSFLQWEDGSSDLARTVRIDADKSIEATFDVVPFIVAWDFAVSEPRGNRPADYAVTTDNTGLLSLYNSDGSSTNWGGSTRNFGTGDINCIRRYTDAANMAAPRSFVARFNTEGYTNVSIHALAAADNDCVHSVQKVQYSTDGSAYTDLGTLELTQKNSWYDWDVTLPAEVNGVVYVRWIGDTSSQLLGTPGAKDTEGFYLADIVVTGDQSNVNDTEAPVLVSSSPAEGSTSASSRGKIILNFNERVKEGPGAITLDGKELKGVYGSKTVTFDYMGLAYGTTYTFSIPAGAITDLNGNAYAGTDISFTTMERPRPEARTFDAVVAADGSGDYLTVQAAVDAAPEARIAPWLIFVKNGEYEELVKIPASKPFIHLIGQDKEKTVIKYWINNGGSGDIGWEYSTNNPASKTYGYQGVFQVDANDFYTENITYLNSYGVEKQAGPMGLAMRSCADRMAVNNCKFRSYQDTWFTTTTNIADRHYINDSWIEGAVDYFYGAGDIYVENTTFYQSRSTGSVVVAPCHKEGTKYGYVIDRCTLDGPGSQHKLGRAWQNEPLTVFLNTTFKTSFAPEGWSEWHIAPALFAEYNSMDADGNPIDLTNRRTEYKVDGQTDKAKRRAILTAEEAARYTYENVTSGNDGWNPRRFFEPVEAPANLNEVAAGVLTWDASDYAICYLVIDGNDNVVAITADTEYRAVAPASRAATTMGDYTVKAVNEYGSLSQAAKVGIATGIADTVAEAAIVSRTYYSTTGMASDRPFAGINIVVEKLADGTTRTYKSVVK